MQATNSDIDHRHFLLKDLYDAGLHIATGQPVTHAKTSTDVLTALSAMDHGFDPITGKPNYDLHIWLGLGFLLLSAGDVVIASTRVDVYWNEEEQSANQWFMGLDLKDHPIAEAVRSKLGTANRSLHRAHNDHVVFVHLTKWDSKEEHTVDAVSELMKPEDRYDLTYKAMGRVTPEQYRARLGAYPLSVHPKLASRAAGAIPFHLISSLGQTGLFVQEHWFPDDTSKGFARYHLTDGVEHYELDFHAPRLLTVLALIDKYEGRTEDVGGIVLDDDTETTSDLAAENPELP